MDPNEMDPNETLSQLLSDAEWLCREGKTENDPYTADRVAMSLAEGVLILDEWLRKGGFLPAGWQNATR